jgi:hypothetical protein
MAEHWEVKLGPCTIMPHPVRNGIILVTKTECMSGEDEGGYLKSPLRKSDVEACLNRHGKDFLELIGNFQRFVVGMLTLGQRGEPDGSGYSIEVERCYEQNRIQRLSLLKYIANEICLRSHLLGSGAAGYPPQEEFDKMKAKV